MKVLLNSDRQKVKSIRKAIKENGGYCPCALVQDETTKCICKEFRDSTKIGYCRCGLYRREE